MQVTARLVTQEAAAGLIAEAQAAAEVKDADEGKEFGRGKRLRYAVREASQPLIYGLRYVFKMSVWFEYLLCLSHVLHAQALFGL